jgi:AraC-like DNA-binding protein
MMSITDGFIPRRCSSADRMMWITPDRVFYAGLLGTPAMHIKGAIMVYVAIEAPLRVRIDGGEWQTTEVAVVQPYVRYEIACDQRHALGVQVEAETVDMARLPPLLKDCGAVHAPEFAAQVRRAHEGLVAAGWAVDVQPSDYDLTFFGEPLPARRLDPRIAATLERIKSNPSEPAAAQECADHVNLSFSRFLHLFKEQVGTPFRSFRTWKRARSLLQYVNCNSSLVNVALDIGYPDSTHFSHSIRQTFGLKPKDIFAGSRKLRLICASPVRSAALAS